MLLTITSNFVFYSYMFRSIEQLNDNLFVPIDEIITSNPEDNEDEQSSLKVEDFDEEKASENEHKQQEFEKLEPTKTVAKEEHVKEVVPSHKNPKASKTPQRNNTDKPAKLEEGKTTPKYTKKRFDSDPGEDVSSPKDGSKPFQNKRKPQKQSMKEQVPKPLEKGRDMGKSEIQRSSTKLESFGNQMQPPSSS